MSLHCDICTFKYPQGWPLNNFAGQPGNWSHISWSLVQKHILNFIFYPICKLGAADGELHLILSPDGIYQLMVGIQSHKVTSESLRLSHPWLLSDRRVYVTIFTIMQQKTLLFKISLRACKMQTQTSMNKTKERQRKEDGIFLVHHFTK